MARTFLVSLIVAFCTGAAVAQDSQNSSEEAQVVASSNAPVAFVYVSRPTHLDGFAASADGKLTPVPGSPYPNIAVSHLSVSKKYLFGVGDDRRHIYSFAIASNGSLRKVAETDTWKYLPDPGTLVGGLIQIDYTGSSLYNFLRVPGGDTYLQAFRIDESGALHFVANTLSDYKFDPLEVAGPTMIHFLGSNQYAVETGCDQDLIQSATDVFRRESTGALKVASWMGQMPHAPTGDRFCPFLLAPDPANHVAFLMREFNLGDPIGWQLATYTADSTGHLWTQSNYKNMPVADGSGTMSIDPTGKLLAVGSLGFRIYHFNGADPITPYSDLLHAEANVLEFGWDKSHHLYILSDQNLYVYTVTPTSIEQAHGSPYSIPQASSVIVLCLK